MGLNKTQYMSELKYKVGDKVRIKGFGWYNENKDEDGNIDINDDFTFYADRSKYCGKVFTISEVFDICYSVKEDNNEYYWTDEMIDCLVERNGKTYPYKIGDRVILKGNNRCATITDLKYNSFGNLSYYIKIDNDKDISTDCPTDLLLPYDNTIEGLVEETKSKFKIGDKVIVSDTSGIWEITDINDNTLYSLKRENHTATLTTYGGFLTLHEGTTDKMIECKVEEKCDYAQTDNLSGVIQVTPSSACSYGFSDFEGDETSEWYLPEGYQFVDENGNVINATKIVLEKKTPKYPTTYKECLSVLGVPDVVIHNAKPSEYKLFESLIRLKRCRDAYWKIYGEENGLGKPWELDWREGRYIIYRNQDDIIRGYREAGCAEHHILSFPTAEMRDYFKENFDTDIEICKEFL